VKRILIADDSPPVRKALHLLLEQTHGWSVIDAEDGQAAVSRAIEYHPDLVVVDLAMPIMDGLTAARQISHALPQLPILMYTMHWTPSLELAAQKSGIRKLIPKSQSTALLKTIEELLGQKAAAPSALVPESLMPLEVPKASAEPAIVPTSDQAATQNSLDNTEKLPEP
jgi:DNA-binding NarL/FixJ family response regulator